MRTRIERVQDKFMLDIPYEYSSALHLEAGMEVSIQLYGGQLTITPVLALEELLTQITSSNLHDEIEIGPGVGRETW